MRWIFAFQLVKLDSLAVYWNSSSEQYASLSNERLLVSTCTYNITTKKEAFSSKMLYFSIGLPLDNLVPLLSQERLGKEIAGQDKMSAYQFCKSNV